jgi:lysophospholipid acyltransferase (LPLAT)-like uncharacterized protein
VASVPAEAIRGRRHFDRRLSPRLRARRDAPLAHRRLRTLRGHRQERPPADHGLLAWPDSARDIYFRRRNIVVITSENFDGEWIAGIKRFGYGTARGSTSRGGRRAFLQLSRELAAGRTAGFTLDGPRGPARVAQPGALWLSKLTGHPVLPFHLEADRCWTTNSWDRTQIPKPFATVSIVVGAPFEVPRDAEDDGIEAARLELEARLRALEARALQMASGA